MKVHELVKRQIASGCILPWWKRLREGFFYFSDEEVHCVKDIIGVQMIGFDC